MLPINNNQSPAIQSYPVSQSSSHVLSYPVSQPNYHVQSYPGPQSSYHVQSYSGYHPNLLTPHSASSMPSQNMYSPIYTSAQVPAQAPSPFQTSLSASHSTQDIFSQTPHPSSSQQGGFVHVSRRKRNSRMRRDHSVSSSSSGVTIVSKSSKKKDTPQRGNIPVSNKFDALRNLNSDEDMFSNEDSLPKEKIPPIFISKSCVQDLRVLITNLKTISVDFSIKDTREFLNLQCGTIDTYRKFSTYLNNKKIEYHSFRLPTDRTIDVVLKNVPTSFTESEISSELETLGYKDFKVMRVWNKEKKPIPVINLYLDKKHLKNKEIYDLTKLLNCIVYIEPKKKYSNVPQCSKCQRFNHTKNYCNQAPRCVYCSGAHTSSECLNKNVENAVPKCVNCNENHTANYKGCKYYVELKKKRFRDNQQLPASNIIHSSPPPDISHFPPLPSQSSPAIVPEHNLYRIGTDHSYSRVAQFGPPPCSFSSSENTQPQVSSDSSSLFDSVMDSILSAIKPFFTSLLAKIKPLLKNFIATLLNGSG